MDQTYVVLRPSKTGEVKRDVLFRFGKYVLVFILHVLHSSTTNDPFFLIQCRFVLPSFNVKQQPATLLAFLRAACSLNNFTRTMLTFSHLFFSLLFFLLILLLLLSLFYFFFLLFSKNKKYIN